MTPPSDARSRAPRRGPTRVPSSSAASCAGVSRITPSSIGGQRNWPPSSRFVSRQSRCRPTTAASRDRPAWRGTRRPHPRRDRRPSASCTNAAKRVGLLAEVHGLRRHQHLQLGSGQDHDALLHGTQHRREQHRPRPGRGRARSPRRSRSRYDRALAASAGGWRRRRRRRRCHRDHHRRERGRALGSGIAARCYRRLGLPARPRRRPACSPRACISSRACRRQPNSCCGLSPCRRATSDTLAPGLRLSTKMRALSSSDHCRRRPVPVISSSRRTVVTSPASAGLAFKRMLKRMVKSIAHGPASSHSPSPPETWGRSTAYDQGPKGARVRARPWQTWSATVAASRPWSLSPGSPMQV